MHHNAVAIYNLIVCIHLQSEDNSISLLTVHPTNEILHQDHKSHFPLLNKNLLNFLGGVAFRRRWGNEDCEKCCAVKFTNMQPCSGKTSASCSWFSRASAALSRADFDLADSWQKPMYTAQHSGISDSHYGNILSSSPPHSPWERDDGPFVSTVHRRGGPAHCPPVELPSTMNKFISSLQQS